MKIAIFGAGYVGCVTATCLASFGHTVSLVESSESKLETLKQAESPIMEPGIDTLLPDLIRKKLILPTASPEEAVNGSDLALICVGTPSAADGSADTRQVQTVFSQIIQALRDRRSAYTIALRSTLPYSFLSAELLPQLQKAFPERYGKDVFFAINPEFLREGSAMKDFGSPPFIIVGTEHPAAADALKTLYQKVSAPFHAVSLGTASQLKYACNAFHAMKIVFANEMASLSPVFEADARQLMEIFCHDTLLNISPAYLRPGFAYGGSCLPKDVKTLNRLSAVAAIRTPLLNAIDKSNTLLIEKAVEIVAELGVRKIGLIGLTFKAGTDDFRNSPLVELAERLLGKGFELSIFDPEIDMRKVHGQNLRYIERRMPHLAGALSTDFKAHTERSELLIIGKNLPGLSTWLDQVPADRTILDLTRQLPLRSKKPPIVYLETLGASKKTSSSVH